MDNVEFLILRNLLHNEEYVRKVIPFIKADYFDNRSQKIVYEEILKFVEQYNKPVTKEIPLVLKQRSVRTLLMVTIKKLLNSFLH